MWSQKMRKSLGHLCFWTVRTPDSKKILFIKVGSQLQPPRAGTSKKKSETQVKSRDIHDLFKRGGSEYTQQKRIEKRKNMEHWLDFYLISYITAQKWYIKSIHVVCYSLGKKIWDFSCGFNFADCQNLDFSRRFNFADSEVFDFSRGFHYAENAKIREIREN